ncbi:MAG: D-arginine dehydrogenase [Granulosicoccus sp.]|jgi:D-arginine dehydrogenase
MANKIHDVAVIGAGIAGVSVAAELDGDLNVLLIEQEPHAGYHSSGRSAAMLAPGYGPSSIRALTRASINFYHSPPPAFTAHPLLHKRDVLMVARPDQIASLDALLNDLAGEDVSLIDAHDIKQRHPLLREGYARAGMLDTRACDIDVHALLQGYLKQFRKNGGDFVTDAKVTALTFTNNVWNIETSAGHYQAKQVVNAAGAWANAIGHLAGAEDIGLVPKRRTALLIDAPTGVDVDDLPLVIDIDEAFYMKPDAGRLLISPANEDPMQPCDVQPEELDIAYCVERIETAFDIDIQKIGKQWAGLRCFVADKSPVVGYSATADNFFWLAGQGGYGVQSAPAISRLASAMLTGKACPSDILASGLELDSISPGRREIQPS